MNGIQQWLPIQESEWIPYSSIPQTGHPWQLVDAPGVKMLQLWAADQAGNISLFPGEIQLNYQPETNQVGLNQGHIFRHQLDEEQCIYARVDPINGDPDLYIWPPDHNAGRPPWVSNLEEGLEEVIFTAPIAGLYQFEAYGFTQAMYRLFVEERTGEDCLSPGKMVRRTEKEFPTPPTTDTPTMRRQLPAPPASGGVSVTPPTTSSVQVYLPIIGR